MRPLIASTLTLLFALPFLDGGIANAGAYDPLALTASSTATTRDFSVNDTKRKREIPIRVYLPTNTKSAPVVLFSHGLGGSREGSVFLGKHWAARGYIAVFLQHPGSDESVWKGVPLWQRRNALKNAANGENFLARVGDVPAVLNQLTLWNSNSNHPLYQRLDLRHIGMSGHSFGAVTTQAVSGQKFARGGLTYTDPRIQAAIAMSPQPALNRNNATNEFGTVTIPWLLMTGTQDDSPIGRVDAASRLTLFPALPSGNKYELVLNKAKHSAFTDRALPGDTGERNPNHHRAILAISTAFWDAYLLGNTAAKKWLTENARSVLEAGDHWQTK